MWNFKNEIIVVKPFLKIVFLFQVLFKIIENKFKIQYFVLFYFILLNVFYLKDHHEKLLSLEVNQILGICHACLELGDWKSAQCFLDRLPPYLAMGSPLIVESLCHLLSHMIEPLYRM